MMARRMLITNVEHLWAQYAQEAEVRFGPRVFSSSSVPVISKGDAWPIIPTERSP
jgi:hypothetical protein